MEEKGNNCAWSRSCDWEKFDSSVSGWVFFDMGFDNESMRNIPNPSHRTSFVLHRVIGSDKIVDGAVKLESLVAVAGEL